MRPAFQSALLNWLRDLQNKEYLEKMTEVLAALEREANLSVIEQLFWVSGGLLAALIAGDLEPSNANKKLLGQLDQQIKKLVDGTETNLIRHSSQALIKSILFEVGKVKSSHEKVVQLKHAFNLDLLLGQASLDAVTDGEDLPAPETLKSIATAVGKEVEVAQQLLSAYFNPIQPDRNALNALSELLQKLSATLKMVQIAPLKALIDELVEVCRAVIDGRLHASESVTMRLAGALLQIENSTRGIQAPDIAWKKQIDERIATLRNLHSAGGDDIEAVEGIEISDAALTETEFKQLLGVVAGEVHVNLRKVEEALETFAASPQAVENIQQVPQYLNQIEGALQILGQERAAELVAIANQYIQDIQGGILIPNQAIFDGLAVAIGTVEVYLEGLKNDRPNLENLIETALQDLDAAIGAKRSDSTSSDPVVHIAAIRQNLELWLDDYNHQEALEALQKHLLEITLLAQQQAQDKIATISAEMNQLLQIVKDDPSRMAQDIPEAIKKSFVALSSLSGQHLHAAKVAPKEQRADIKNAAPQENQNAAVDSLRGPTPVSAPTPAAPAAKPDDFDEEIMQIFIEDATDVLQKINAAFPEWQANPDNQNALLELRRAFHTLKGSGRMVGASEISELAWPIEQLLNQIRDGKTRASEVIIALIQQVRDVLPALIEQLAGGPPPAVDVAALRARAEELANTLPPLLDENADYGDASIPTLTIEAAFMEEAPAEEAPSIDSTLLQIFTVEVQGHLTTIKQAAADGSNALVPVSAGLLRAAHTLQGSARALKLLSMAEVYAEMEKLLHALEDRQMPLDDATLGLFGKLDEGVTRLLLALNNGKAISHELNRLFDGLSRAFKEKIAYLHAQHPTDEPVPGGESVLEMLPDSATGAGSAETIDSELVEIFNEEAADILDSIEEALTRWRNDPADTGSVKNIQRSLHTLKGGARMAGATAIGNISHNTESLLRRVEDGQIAADVDLFDLLEEARDALVSGVNHMRDKRPVSSDLAALNTKLLNRLGGAPGKGDTGFLGENIIPGDNPEEEDAADFLRHMGTAREKPERREQIKVQTRLLNNLQNYAGEVSIARSRMEQQIFGFREHLSELNRNVIRFRDQIRELEIQSESQILYRADHQEALVHSDFDPLEFDRYSKLQHISRSLAETLHDLSTIQMTMNNFAGEAETVLQQQARVNTDLQEGLMRTRMISFSTQAARLRHIVRQTARELDKRAELHIAGNEVEVDRNVLERMIGPFEHMIRNAIDHGIESEMERKRAHKPLTGKITVHTSHEGSEIIIRFSDDGGGLDVVAIRKQAIARGLMAPDANLSEEEIMQFILLSGFSTAKKVTHLSGRGVGMDVVHNEVKQLGGSITAETERGVGTTFVIRLPLTLSITQALMVYVADQTFAVPLASVVNILEMPVEKLNTISMEEKPLLHHEDHAYPFMHLGARLGFVAPARGTKVPVLLAKSGARQIAIQVDGLGGTREVVIKTLGPQLSEIKGMAGATILGDGRVILILDIGGLWISDEAMHVVRAHRKASIAESERSRPLIMVVDDSLTVRKITSRHLQKQGMDVMVAKDGLDAVEQLRQQIPDVMLVDIEMPRMDGYELTTNVRSDPTLRHIPIIMITSRAGAKHKDRAMQLGVDLYMSKPYQEDELLRSIETMLTRRTIH
jgi:chemosensory pili system protein ChpA (sensor histidine kinase/response regulator)